MPEAGTFQVGARRPHGKGARGGKGHVDAGAGRHADGVPAFVRDVHARLRQRHGGKASLALGVPAADQCMTQAACAGTPGLAAIEHIAAISSLLQLDARARHFRAPHAPAAAGRRARPIDFRQDGQRIGMAFIQLEHGEVDGGHAGQRLPAPQGGAVAGQGQVVQPTLLQAAQGLHGRQWAVLRAQQGAQCRVAEIGIGRRGMGNGRHGKLLFFKSLAFHFYNVCSVLHIRAQTDAALGGGQGEGQGLR
ncbi:hypothetical protein JaAD80_07665 [Janthinobacterium sp. AD80]|nr:hypothetical protein JaAD80_07665 [Janthinobacterium sp. AD80]